MPDYLQDIEIDDSGDVVIDDGNDVSLIGGRGNVEQSVRIQTGDEVSEFIGGQVTGSSVGLLEEKLKNALNSDPQVGEVQSVSIDEIDKQYNVLTVSVYVEENDNFTIGVSG